MALLRLPVHTVDADITPLRAQGYDVVPGRETPTYRPEWDSWAALRDIVQNALDETESFSMVKSREGLIISDAGGGFNAMALLLGQPVAKPPHLRGRFGEGLKIAVLAMLRQGFPVTFESGELEGAATFLRTSFAGTQAETLTFVVRRRPPRPGTRWYIWNYSGNTYAERFAQNLTAPSAQVPATLRSPIPRLNRIWTFGRPGASGQLGVRVVWIESGGRYTPPPGAIYARNIFMQRIPSPFTYDLWDFELAPDRFGPRSERDLERAIADTWTGVTSPTLIALLLRWVQQNSEIYESRMWWPGPNTRGRVEANKTIWLTAWREAFGGAVLQTDAKFNANLTYLNANAIEMPNGFSQICEYVIPTDGDFIRQFGQDLVVRTKQIPHTNLLPAQRENLEFLRKINQLLPTRDDKNRANVIAANVGEGDVNGSYDKDSNVIMITTDALASPIDSVDTFIHEYAHYYTQASDMTTRHTLAISAVGAFVLELYGTGKLTGWLTTGGAKL